jgi:hypothetical protein
MDKEDRLERAASKDIIKVVETAASEIIDPSEIEGYTVRSEEEEDKAEAKELGIKTKFGHYTPTAAERRILNVLTDPRNSEMPVREICRVANVNKDTFYKCKKKPEFNEYYNKLIMLNLADKVAPILNATYKFAVGSAKNHQDRKLLLQMAGVYIEKVEHSGNQDSPLKVIFDIPRPPREELE